VGKQPNFWQPHNTCHRSRLLIPLEQPQCWFPDHNRAFSDVLRIPHCIFIIC
jgi:hypothetical protein